jgi:hypothetical protein
VNADKQDPPLHQISRPEDRQRLLAEAMEHADAQEAQYRLGPPDEPTHGLWKAPVALAIFTLAALVGIFPWSWLGGPPPLRIEDSDLDHGLRAVMYIQAQQVNVFRMRTGRIPDALDDLPVRFPGLRLVKSNNRVFQILAYQPGGEVLVFDSGHPSPAFAAAVSGWDRGEAPR